MLDFINGHARKQKGVPAHFAGKNKGAPAHFAGKNRVCFASIYFDFPAALPCLHVDPLRSC